MSRAVAQDDSPRTSSSSSIPRSAASADPSVAVLSDQSLVESPFELQVAEAVEFQTAKPYVPVIYPELDRYREYSRPAPGKDFEGPSRLATSDLPPPTPASMILSGSSSQLSAFSASPSTKFSESPGPGPYSRDTTPTSMSSQSPNLVAPMRQNPPKPRLNSPAYPPAYTPAYNRPPVTRRRAGSFPNEVDAISADPHGLAMVRESLTSSSSNSTVRDGDKNRQNRKKADKLPPPQLSPPPRKSSQKFNQDRQGTSLPKKTQQSSSESSNVLPSSRLPSPSVSSPLASARTGTPSRPSREGTPDMQSQLFDPVPIIQSNLSSSSLPLERRGSEPAVPSSLPASRGPSSGPIKNASTTNLTSDKALSPASKRPGLATEKKILAIPEPERPTRTPSPNVGSSFNGRFAFFGRKKTSTEAEKEDKKKKKKDKSGRKGPVAGTGHEGYGRVGAVRRRSGSTSSANRAQGFQSSQESLESNDPFLADRMNPVIIAGGEVIENRNPSSELSRTESNQSITRSATGSKATIGSEMSSTSLNEDRTTLWPSALPRGPARRPSDSSDSDGVTMKSALAFRRSIQRLRSSPDNPLRLPHPINTSGTAQSPMTSFDTSVMSDESSMELQPETRRGRDPAHPAPKKLVKRARSPRKWNLFGRSQSNSEAQKKDDQVAATITAVEKKPLAYYTMLDSSEPDESEVNDIQEVLRNAEVYKQSPRSFGTPELQQRPATNTPPLHLREVQRDAFTDSPESQSSAQAPIFGPATALSRPRLAQVGRIPHVVNNRPEQRPPMSFSRPFRASLQVPPRVLESVDPEGRPSTSSKSGTTVPELIQDGSTTGSSTNFSSSRGSVSGISTEVRQGEREFLAFSPRKDSDDTNATSSGSSVRNPIAGAPPSAPPAAEAPPDDEIWDEYNDLLGDDNLKAPLSATSSKGVPFHLEPYHKKLPKDKAMESPTVPHESRQISTHSRATHSSSYSADMTERIRNAFQPHQSPTTALPLDVTSVRRKRSQSLDLAAIERPGSRRNSAESWKRQSQHSSSSSDDGSPLSQVNLRVGSMTVSKWLTFGHVLFSDVRHELVPVEGSLKRQCILVIDGLGNDDWSFYAAETYPAATFFNLSPRAPLPDELQNSPTGFPLSPPNHHQVQYLSHLEKFPFAAQSFTSVVYRFPMAAGESSYRNILTEARRVLKPGGYIELSILDVDLNNMGNRGRRTIRRLKEQIHGRASDTNLASTADLILRLLGKAGFAGIKAARVGVPVASSIAGSSSGRTKGKSSADGKKRDKPSLAEMMNDDSAVADEGITKMVARVGRWWYTRCYENATGSPGAKSIWNERALLSECEELGTSLKLMVCCARAPDRITSY